MKNNFIIAIFVLLIGVSLFSGIVSAQYYSDFRTESIIDSVTQVLEPILIALFGGDSYTGYLIFEKLLLFILVGVIVFLSLNNLPLFKDKNKSLSKLIAVIVALIGIRNIDYFWLNTIFTQYVVLFVAIAGILPFIIYWFFLKEMSALPRKVGWIFFTVVYFGLWITTDVEAHEEIYLITALASLVYAFFIDAWVHNQLEIQDMKKGDKLRLSETIATISSQIEDIDEKLIKGHYRNIRAEKLAEEKVKRLEKRIRKLQKGL
tara:strand:+ start:131 stop:916 length:786 start_codon:yes stop_codon:yes gene_type:complete